MPLYKYAGAAALLVTLTACTEERVGSPIPTVTFTAQNGMQVVQTGPADIAVAYEAQQGDTDYWCAAADYAQRVLNQPGATRLWRATPKPRKAGEGIVFTLDQAKKAEGAGISQYGKGPRDGSVSLTMAGTNFCQTRIPLFR